MKISRKILAILSSLVISVSFLPAVAHAKGEISINLLEGGKSFSVSFNQDYSAQGFDGIVLFFSELENKHFALETDTALLFKRCPDAVPSYFAVDGENLSEITDIGAFSPVTCTHFCSFPFEELLEILKLEDITEEMLCPIDPPDEEAVRLADETRARAAEDEDFAVALCLENFEFEQLPREVLLGTIRNFRSRGELVVSMELRKAVNEMLQRKYQDIAIALFSDYPQFDLLPKDIVYRIIRDFEQQGEDRMVEELQRLFNALRSGNAHILVVVRRLPT